MVTVPDIGSTVYVIGSHGENHPCTVLEHLPNGAIRVNEPGYNPPKGTDHVLSNGHWNLEPEWSLW